MEALEARTMAKVSRRLIPFVIICYFVAFLDRVNLGFAALEMNKDLGFSATVYGLGAGMFFISYFLLETPSNLILVRTGARVWIAQIMFTWGILSGAMAFVQGETRSTSSASCSELPKPELFPGILFYLTLFFPAAYRGRMVAMCYGGDSVFRRDRLTVIQRNPLRRRFPRLARLAMGIHLRGGARNHPVRRGAVVSD